MSGRFLIEYAGLVQILNHAFAHHSRPRFNGLTKVHISTESIINNTILYQCLYIYIYILQEKSINFYYFKLRDNIFNVCLQTKGQ